MALRTARRLQISLRTLLILTAAIAVALAAWPLRDRLAITLAFVAFTVAPISLMAILDRTSVLGRVQRRWAVIALLMLLLSLPFLFGVAFAGMLVFLALLVWTPQLGAIW